MLASLKIDMGIIKICHFLLNHINYASLTSHRLIHIPESDMTIRRNGLLVADQIPHSGHGAELSILVFLFAVAHTDQQNTGFRKSSLQMLYHGKHSFLIIIVFYSSFRSHIQTVLDHNQIVWTKTLEIAKRM